MVMEYMFDGGRRCERCFYFACCELAGEACEYFLDLFGGEEREAVRDVRRREAEFYQDWPEYVDDDDDGVPMVRATKLYEVEVQDDESEGAAVCIENRQLSA